MKKPAANATNIRFLILAGIIGLSGILVAYLNPPSGDGGTGDQPLPAADTRPAVWLKDMQHDFGRSFSGEAVSHTFTLSNPSDQAIEMQDFRPNCSCTLLDNPPKKIDPGASIDVPVSFNVNSSAEGRVGTEIMVLFENHPPIRLHLVGDAIRALPGKINLGRVLRGQSPSKTILFKPVLASPERIESLEYDDRFFAVTQGQEQNDNSDSGRSESLLITVRPDAPYGEFTDRLRVKTTHPTHPLHVVELKVHVLEPVTAEPALVTAGRIESGQTKHVEIRLVSPYKQAFAINTVHSENEHVRPQIDHVDTDGCGATLGLSIDGSFVGPLLSTSVEVNIQTSGGEDRRIDIPVYAVTSR